MDEKKMMDYAKVFMEHCMVSMEETGQLSEEGYPSQFAEMRDDNLVGISLKQLADWVKDNDDDEDYSHRDILELAQGQATKKKVPWISCTNQYLSIEHTMLKGYTPEKAYEKIDEIIEKAAKVEITPGKIIPKKIEVLRFMFNDGENQRAELISRVKRGIDKTELEQPYTMPEFIESLNKIDFIEK